jgi:hypothetical protein
MNKGRKRPNAVALRAKGAKEEKESLVFSFALIPS